MTRLLAALPFLGILVGTPFFNRTTPSLLGLPVILVWLVAWVIATSVLMAIVYRLDPSNRHGAEETSGP